MLVDKLCGKIQKADMTTEEIQERIEQKPFQPFKVRLTDGAEIDVPTGDQAHLHPNGSTLFVHLDRGGTKIIDITMVTALQVMEMA